MVLISCRNTSVWLVVFLGYLFINNSCLARNASAPDSSQSNPFSIGQVLFTKLKNTQREYQQAVASGDSLQIGEACYLMGKRYGALGDYLTAHRWFIRSLRIREPHGPSEGIGKVYARLAENYTVQGQYAEALVYARRALNNCQRAKAPAGLLSSYIVLAGIHLWYADPDHSKTEDSAQVSLDSARYYYRLAERVAMTLPDRKNLANLYNCLSNVYQYENPAKAIPYLKQGLAIYTQEKDPYGQLNLLKHLAKVYMTLGQTEAARQALDRASQLRDTHQIADFGQNKELETHYAEFYQLAGDWQKAFRHLKKAHAFEDAMLKANREGAMARLSVEYETGKKEAQLKAQHEHLRTQKRLTLAITGLLILAAGLSFLFFYLYRKNQPIRHQNAQLVYEQSHRVKNNLQVISSLLGLQSNRLSDQVAKQAVEESQLRVEVMSLLHRRLYDHEQLIDVKLTQFIPDLVKNVLEAYGFDHLEPKYDTEPIRLHIDKAIPLGLILNELVTNCCKYAFLSNPNPALQITSHKRNDHIFIRISDNGPGFTLKQPIKSFGLRLVELQIRQLKGVYNCKNDQGTVFTISFKV